MSFITWHNEDVPNVAVHSDALLAVRDELNRRLAEAGVSTISARASSSDNKLEVALVDSHKWVKVLVTILDTGHTLSAWNAPRVAVFSEKDNVCGWHDEEGLDRLLSSVVSGCSSYRDDSPYRFLLMPLAFERHLKS